jgi:hypothetical protein
MMAMSLDLLLGSLSAISFCEETFGMAGNYVTHNRRLEEIINDFDSPLIVLYLKYHTRYLKNQKFT